MNPKPIKTILITSLMGAKGLVLKALISLATIALTKAVIALNLNIPQETILGWAAFFGATAWAIIADWVGSQNRAGVKELQKTINQTPIATQPLDEDGFAGPDTNEAADTIKQTAEANSDVIIPVDPELKKE